MMFKYLLVALGAIRAVHGWGVLGHATVAYVAQHFLDNDVASWTQGVLGDTSDSYLANVASWADTYRATAAGKWSAPLHFIDAEDSPPAKCNVDYDRDCGSSGCSISAVANYTRRVGDGRLSKANQAEALKFLVHFLGDITQPLHDEAYEIGGNDIKVTFNGYSGDNLHLDWDTYMPEKLIGGHALTDAQSWANTLITDIVSGLYKSKAASWIAESDVTDPISSATAWASDANAYVCTVVMPDGAAALQRGDLYPIYYNSVIPTIELQIAKGGYRLAHWLNSIYSANIAKRSVHRLNARKPLPDLTGRDLLPSARPLSRAKLAREAMSGNCSQHAFLRLKLREVWNHDALGSEGGHRTIKPVAASQSRSCNAKSKDLFPNEQVFSTMASPDNGAAWDVDVLRTKFSLALSEMYRQEVLLHEDIIQIVRDIDASILKTEGRKLNYLPSRIHLERHEAVTLG
ncbi:hypothetical protein FSARC_6259 [Fusarium sarcochroum]|uniref:Nuclease PA3 n=1 Tax=Fusarium sarcochroum TaxID=1208366 RepID=A0A8H4X9J4_9HYPO|nr:hypothetical protein FSARC_6259 [Fusarium sarcochroum]